MVSDKLIVTLLIVAILLSVFSIIMTLSLNTGSTVYQNPENIPTNGFGQAKVQLEVIPNPEAGGAA